MPKSQSFIFPFLSNNILDGFTSEGEEEQELGNNKHKNWSKLPDYSQRQSKYVHQTSKQTVYGAVAREDSNMYYGSCYVKISMYTGVIPFGLSMEPEPYKVATDRRLQLSTEQ